MKLKNNPIRTCMGCNKESEKLELLRIVRTTDGEVKLDFSGKLNGRGAYICNNISCLEKALKTNRLQRALNKEIPGAVVELMKKEIANGQ